MAGTYIVKYFGSVYCQAVSSFAATGRKEGKAMVCELFCCYNTEEISWAVTVFENNFDSKTCKNEREACNATWNVAMQTLIDLILMFIVPCTINI